MKQLALDTERDEDQLSLDEVDEVVRDFGELDRHGDLLPRAEAV